MDLSVLLPPELLTAALPESRAVPPFQERPGTGSDAASALLPFAFLLQQASATPLPAGEALPPTGKTLPPVAAQSALPLDLPAVLGARLDARAAPPASPNAPFEGAAFSGATAGGLPIDSAAALDAAMLATSPDAAAPADTPSPREAVPSVAPQPSGAAFDLDLPRTAASAPPALPGAELGQAQSAAQMTAAPAPADGEPRPLPKTVSALPDVRNTDAATRAPEPAAPLELGAAARDDMARPLAVTADTPLVSKSTQRAARATLPSIGAPDAVSGTQSAAAHGPTTGPPQPAVGAPAVSTQSQPPPHPHGDVDTTAARWNETLANRIHWLVDHDIGEARIKLHPAELGALDVTISMQDDKTYVQLTAHSASARDELAQSLPRLRELLTAHGLELGGASVSGGRDERPSHGPHAAPGVRALDGVAAVPLDDLPRAARGARSQIDVFA